MTRRASKLARLLSPRAKEIAKRMREERWYDLLSTCPHDGARRLAAALLVGAIDDELDAEERAQRGAQAAE